MIFIYERHAQICRVLPRVCAIRPQRLVEVLSGLPGHMPRNLDNYSVMIRAQGTVSLPPLLPILAELKT